MQKAPASPDPVDTVSEMVSALTLEEKLSLLAGVDDWHLQGVPRLGIPSVRVTDCGHGVTLCGDRSSPATCFPTAIGMASTWNEALIERVGAAIGREARILGCSILLGPKANLHRLPLNGRSYETFSEDPVLAGRLAAAEIRGIQSQGVGACLKALAANNQQMFQNRISSEVDERTLRELYLRVFEIAIELGKPCAVMTSYNRINGHYAAENRWLIQEIIKGEWQFPGFVVSDWYGVRSEMVYQSGIDLEMPGPGRFLNRQGAYRAYSEGLFSEKELNDKVTRILRALFQYGRPEEVVELQDCPEHRALAREVAEESIVLLKNEGEVLPLDRRSIRRLLVIGPNAAHARLGGGGSASVTPFRAVSPLEGIQTLCKEDGVEVIYREGCSLVGAMQPIPAECFECLDDTGSWRPGLEAAFFNSGHIKPLPDAKWRVPDVNFSWGWASPGPGVLRSNYAVRFTGRFIPPVTGRYRLGVFGQEGWVRLCLGGTMVVDEWSESDLFEENYRSRHAVVEREFVGGEPVELVLDYAKRAAQGAVRLEWELPGSRNAIEEAVEVARSADAVVVCAGLSNLFEGGARDRDGIDLPPAQVRLIEAMAEANPRTVVVLFNGGPLALPWEPKVPAILEAWYPGEEGGTALAHILFGETNPSGRLPDTIAYRLEDHAAYQYYPGDGDTVCYREGLHIGYRHFDTANIQPHFPFGFGLSYTTFRISAPELDTTCITPGGTARVRVTVQNTGMRKGKETVQLYVRPIDPPVPRPDKELRGFQKVNLEPGETKELHFTITGRDLAYYDLASKAWRVAPGKYEILAGSHSRSLLGITLTVSTSEEKKGS